MTHLLHIHTGGTICMAPGPDGLAPEAGLVERHMDALMPNGVTLTRDVLNPLIDSSEAGPREWNRMIRVIALHHDKVDGVIITHGTDSMAYAAAALVLGLPGLGIPVVMTGSMKALSLPDNDGEANLATAIDAAQSSAPGVWLAFAGKVLPGHCLIKQSATAFDAFMAAEDDGTPRQDAATFSPQVYGIPNVATLTVTPGLDGDVVAHILEAVDGLVLRAYGAGSVPNDSGISEALATAAASGKTIIAVSQCLAGGMDWSTYAASAGLRRAGVIDGGTMTAEMALVKLTLDLS